MVQNEIKASHPTSLEVLVDDGCAGENVTRFASNHGYSVKKEAHGDEFTLVLEKNA